MMPYYYGYGYPLFGGVLHMLWVVVSIAFVIWLLSVIFRCGPRRMRRWHLWQTHDALGILNERFAKGEIDKAEYEERKKTLLADLK